MARLQKDYASEGKGGVYEALHGFLSKEPAEGDYARTASQLGLSPGAVSVAVHRLRHRYRELVGDEIAQTVANPADIEGSGTAGIHLPEIREEKAAGRWQKFDAASRLGGILLDQRRYGDAEPLLLYGFGGLCQRETGLNSLGKSRHRQARSRLVQLYESSGRPELAALFRIEH
jgi:hypothetical protein